MTTEVPLFVHLMLPWWGNTRRGANFATRGLLHHEGEKEINKILTITLNLLVYKPIMPTNFFNSNTKKVEKKRRSKRTRRQPGKEQKVSVLEGAMWRRQKHKVSAEKWNTRGSHLNSERLDWRKSACQGSSPHRAQQSRPDSLPAVSLHKTTPTSQNQDHLTQMMRISWISSCKVAFSTPDRVYEVTPTAKSE